MMTGSIDRTGRLRMMSVTLVAALLTVGLAGCAPEPNAAPTGKPSAESTEEPSWPEAGVEDADKNAQLPMNFPGAFVPLPTNFEVDNTGERGEGAWFVVLRADSLEAASTMLDEVAADGAFEVTDESETGDGGRSATLTVDGYVVTALTLMEGKQALLSLDVSSTQI